MPFQKLYHPVGLFEKEKYPQMPPMYDYHIFHYKRYGYLIDLEPYTS